MTAWNQKRNPASALLLLFTQPRQTFLECDTAKTHLRIPRISPCAMPYYERVIVAPDAWKIKFILDAHARQRYHSFSGSSAVEYPLQKVAHQVNQQENQHP